MRSKPRLRNKEIIFFFGTFPPGENRFGGNVLLSEDEHPVRVLVFFEIEKNFFLRVPGAFSLRTLPQ